MKSFWINGVDVFGPVDLDEIFAQVMGREGNWSCCTRLALTVERDITEQTLTPMKFCESLCGRGEIVLEKNMKKNLRIETEMELYRQ